MYCLHETTALRHLGLENIRLHKPRGSSTGLSTKIGLPALVLSYFTSQRLSSGVDAESGKMLKYYDKSKLNVIYDIELDLYFS